MNFDSILKKIVKSSLKGLIAKAKPKSRAKTNSIEAHARTMTALNDARTSVLEAHADDATQMQFLAVLDSHNCVQCGLRDGLRWYVKSKKPVGHTLEWKQPPIHIGCRCTFFSVTPLTDLPGGGRASEFGVVEGRTTFDEFLKLRAPEFQNKVLGAERAKIWRDKKLSLRDLVDASGRELTLDELRAKYSA